MPVSWGTVTETNRHIYVAEEAPFYTVLATAQKVYLTETIAGTTTQRVATIPVAMYDGPALAVALASALGAGYSASFAAGVITVSFASGTFQIASRVMLLAAKTWSGQPLVYSALEDASDVLGTTTTPSTGTLTLGKGLVYRKLSLTIGAYSADTLATEVAAQLNSATKTLTSPYTVNLSPTTGRLTIQNATAGLTFHWYPETFLDKNPYAFQGYAGPFYGSDSILGISSLSSGPFTGSEHVNVMAHHTLFIASSLGEHTDSYGPIGQTTIARKVIVDQAPGGFVNDFHSTALDFVSIESQSISALTFRVTDWKGQTVDMMDWSCSIILVSEDQF